MSTQLPGLAAQIAYFENRLAADPLSRAFLPLADLYRRAGKLERARHVLERGLTAHPGFLTARAALGLVLAELGDAAAARVALRAVLEHDPENLLAMRLLVRDATTSGEWSTVGELGERLLRLEPDAPGLRSAVREARRHLEAAAAGATPAPRPRRLSDGFETPTLANLYLRQGYPEKARAILERILAVEPNRADAREMLARLDAGPAVPVDRRVPTAAAGEGPGPDARAAAAPDVPASGRSQDLDRFRAWLDAATETRDPAG